MSRMWLMTVSLCCTASIAIALTPCNYTIPEYGGTPCNELPPPPPEANPAPDCVYYWCDENIGCSLDPNRWQKKTRTRRIKSAGLDPVQYYSAYVSDDNSGCCKCED